MVVLDTVKDRFTSAMRTQILNDAFWKKIEYLISVLKPVIKINIELEGNGVLIHKVNSNFQTMRDDLFKAMETNNTLRTNEKNSIINNSTFGWIHSNKRNRLHTVRAGKITYLAHNWKLLNRDKLKPIARGASSNSNSRDECIPMDQSSNSELSELDDSDSESLSSETSDDSDASDATMN